MAKKLFFIMGHYLLKILIEKIPLECIHTKLLQVINHIFHLQVPKTVYVTECTEDVENKCTEQWICLDYPKPASLKQCKNKKWQPTGDCKDIYVEKCKDVQKQIYE